MNTTEACRNPKAQEIARGIVSELERPNAPRLSMGDHLMAAQLKSMLGAKKLSDIEEDDIAGLIQSSTSQIVQWLKNTDRNRIAHAIRLALEEQTQHTSKGE